jgi:hypothetical protein
MKGGGDLSSAAAALGVQHRDVPKDVASLKEAFGGLAQAAQMTGAEIIELSGSPPMMNGRTVRVIAVVLPASEKA